MGTYSNQKGAVCQHDSKCMDKSKCGNLIILLSTIGSLKMMIAIIFAAFIISHDNLHA